MRKQRIQPFDVVPASVIRREGWSVQYGSSSREPLPEYLRDWDYQSNVSFYLDLELNVRDVLSNTGIADARSVAVVAVLECTATNVRTVQSARISLDQPKYCLKIESGQGVLASSVDLWSALVLIKDTERESLRSPHRAGSRLLALPAAHVVLEGDAARFPTEATSFGSLGWQEALWKVQVDATSLDEPFNGGVRLFLNSDLKEAKLLAESTTENMLSRFLEIDIARAIFSRLATLTLTEEVSNDEHVAGTVGHVANSLATNIFRSDLGSCVERLRSDPQGFEVALQSRYRPWSSK